MITLIFQWRMETESPNITQHSQKLLPVLLKIYILLNILFIYF